jgi:hypothetical protein
MVAAPTARLITPEEFLRMPESEGAGLVDGIILETDAGAEAAFFGAASRAWCSASTTH